LICADINLAGTVEEHCRT